MAKSSKRQPAPEKSAKPAPVKQPGGIVSKMKIQVGPITPPPGSRLKSPPKPKANRRG